MRKAN